MPTESGFSNQKKFGKAQHKTIHNLGSDRFGTSVSGKSLYELTADIAITAVLEEDAGEDTGRFLYLEITAHSARFGDIIRMTSGNLIAYEFEILEVVDANTVKVPHIAYPDLPIVTDTVKAMRWVTNKSDDEGNLNFSPGPTQFVRDGLAVQVVEDTVTPANNVPLPVKLTGVTGDITITAQNLNVQSTHTGANPDSMQIGDGTETLAINAGGEALVHDQDTHDKLDLLDAKLGSLGQKASAGSAPVVLSTEQEAILSDIATKSSLLNIVDQLDLVMLDPSQGAQNIPASSGGFLEVVTSLAAAVKQIHVIEDIGEFIGLYTGLAAAETFLCVLPPGFTGAILPVQIAAGTRLSIRNMKNAAITTDTRLAINFLG